jgi:hypothetical protein
VTGNHGKTDIWVVRLDSNRNKLWQKTFGGTDYDGASSLIATLDGGYLVGGYTLSINGDVTDSHGGYDCWIIKLDAAGNLLWQKTYGGTGYDAGTNSITTSDGGYIMAGTTQSNDGDVMGNHGGSDFWLVKLDGAGNKLWQKTYGGRGNDETSSFITTSDGGYVLAGSTQSNELPGFRGNTDYWVIKLDGAGNLIWQKTLGGSSVEYPGILITTSDGGYVVAGWTISNDGDVTGNHGAADGWLVKLNGMGNLVWQKTLGGTRDDFTSAVVATADGGYVVSGQTQSNNGDVTGNHGNGDGWLIKLNGAGNLVWQKPFGGTNNDSFGQILAIPDKSYVVVGRTESNNGDVSGNHGSQDYWIVKLGVTPSISGLTANPNPVCGGKPVLLTATIGDFTGSYNYSVTTGAGTNLQATSPTPTFSQTLIASGSGTQSFTLTVANSVGITSSILSVTVNGDGNCSIPTPCASVQSGNWSDSAIWLCGHEPTVTDLVIINPSHVVTISTDSAQAQRISNNGTIRYASTGTKVFIKGD